MNRVIKNLLLTAAILSMTMVVPAQRDLKKIEESLKADVPKILCVDKNFATAGQPNEQAFAKLAANGFRSVLNLRTAGEGVDLERERQLVQQAGLKYVNIPVVSSAPKAEQATEFLRVVKDSANHPMLIHCAAASRVGAFWIIYRMLEHGWPEDKAVQEATMIGLNSPGLKQFALDYVGSHKKSK